VKVTSQPEDGVLQVEVALPLRPRRRKAGPDAQIAPGPDLTGPRRIPRITRLMALAIKFQDMVNHDEVRDYADLLTRNTFLFPDEAEIARGLLRSGNIQSVAIQRSCGLAS
jgi:hypothetical protein